MKEGGCMSKEQHSPNSEQPITGVTWLIGKQCRDCVFRYKDYFRMGDKKIPCSEEDGWKKSSCEIFPYPQSKPPEVEHNTGKCEYYEKEKQRKK